MLDCWKLLSGVYMRGGFTRKWEVCLLTQQGVLCPTVLNVGVAVQKLGACASRGKIEGYFKQM